MSCPHGFPNPHEDGGCADPVRCLEAADAEVERLRKALEDVLPAPGYPKCNPQCVTVRGAAYDEDPRCDCAEGEQRWRFDQARAALAGPSETT